MDHRDDESERSQLRAGGWPGLAYGYPDPWESGMREEMVDETARMMAQDTRDMLKEHIRSCGQNYRLLLMILIPGLLTIIGLLVAK